MSDSPAQATPYEVLGVSPAASQEDLRRAYRRRARETHPDLGGSDTQFRAVQIAWERIGDPEERAVYDRGRGGSSTTQTANGFRPPTAGEARADTRPRARAYGHPGGQSRERFLALLREWVGRGVDIPDPYDPNLVQRAPREIRRVLAEALAEEHTVRTVTDLGMGFTIWSDVDVAPEHKLDHIVLGPTGLFAVFSEDWGGPVTVAKGEIAGDDLAPDEEPVRDITRSARAFEKLSRLRFTALIIVSPDLTLNASVQVLDRGRKAPTLIARASVLSQLLRDGVSDGRHIGDIFEIRSRIQEVVRFV
jgi:molecular chaperone DnaJ